MTLRNGFFALFAFCALTSSVQAESTKTPIKHIVVIYQENRTFDHYFGTYPHAENKPGETKFFARKNTPSVNGLAHPLKKINKNLAQPFRFSPAQADTGNPAHDYMTLQQACDKGMMDMFVQTTGQALAKPNIMGYFDGNTVTALWNYAQYFAMSDNFHTTTIGASTVGAINLVSGQQHGAIPISSLNAKGLQAVTMGTIINDIDPTYDNFSQGPTAALTGQNVGNLLNAKKITWGWFQGGFANPTATHIGPGGVPVVNYVPHHDPFQYYASTANPQHLPPSSFKKVGKTDRANHNYDISDFWKAIEHGVLPRVSFLKAAAFQNGHGGNSTPLLEQEFLVSTINRLQKLPQWKNMAIIIAYDDSGGWYDHECPPIVNQSQIAQDAFTAPGFCGTQTPLANYQGRPNYGMRVPCIVISPWAKVNYVDHKLIDQTSILQFIEYNWSLGQIGDFSMDAFANPLANMFDFKERKFRRLILDHKTGSIRHKEGSTD